MPVRMQTEASAFTAAVRAWTKVDAVIMPVRDGSCGERGHYSPASTETRALSREVSIASKRRRLVYFESVS